MQRMTQAPCHKLGCPYEIGPTCSQCQFAYCLKHMAQGSTLCHGCIEANRATGESIMTWGFWILIGGLGLMIIGFFSGGISPSLALGGTLFLGGIITLMVGYEWSK